jgi:tRNA(fMet)-specific endonuclease VapC
MTYLLDTNACIRFLQGRAAQLLERFAAVSTAEKYLCAVVIGELYYGAFKSEWPAENLEKLDAFIGHFALLPFDVNAARHFGEIRAHLARVPGLRLDDWET